MWTDANQGSKVALKDLHITEMSLTGNMPLSEMLERKIKWKTLDDDIMSTKKLNYECCDSVMLGPQRIRVFEVTFIPSELAHDGEALFLNM